MLAGLLGLSGPVGGGVVPFPLWSILMDFLPQEKPHLPLRVCLAGDLYLFSQHFLMNSIPKEANFLAGSGGSGSGYGGGWDSVQRFDHGSCRIWVLGAPGADSGSSGGECPSPLLLLFMREVLFVEGEMWSGDISHPSPKFMQGSRGFAGRTSADCSSWASFQECGASFPAPLLPSSLFPRNQASS